MQNNELDFKMSLLGKTLRGVAVGEDSIIFTVSEEEIYKMYHRQDCCEYVELEDVCGNIRDILGEPLTEAEEVSNEGENKAGIFKWTFYKLRTVKGSVVLR